MPKKVVVYSEKYGWVLAPEFQDMEVDIYNLEGPSKHTMGAKVTVGNTVLYSYGHREREIKEQRTNIVSLLTDLENMKTVRDGIPYSEEFEEKRFDERAGRFKTGNPFSAFTVENEDDEVVGHIIAGGSGKHPITRKPLTGKSEVAIVIDKDNQKQRHGTRAMAGITYAWGNHLAKHGYKVNGIDNFEAFWATASNAGSKVFDANGYEWRGVFAHPEYKSRRDEYEISAEKVVAVYANTGKSLRA